MSNRFIRMRLERIGKPTPPSPDRNNSEGDSTRFWMAVSSIAACGATLFAGWAAWETRASALEAARATKAAVWMQTLSAQWERSYNLRPFGRRQCLGFISRRS